MTSKLLPQEANVGLCIPARRCGSSYPERSLGKCVNGNEYETGFSCSDPSLAIGDAGVDFILRKGEARCSFRVSRQALDNPGDAPDEARAKDLVFMFHQKDLVAVIAELQRSDSEQNRFASSGWVLTKRPRAMKKVDKSKSIWQWAAFYQMVEKRVLH